MLEVDVHEPDKFEALVRPVMPCDRLALNEAGWGDYRWQTVSGRWVNVERKTWGEVLASIDAVEDQLRRHKKNQPEARLIFVLEGYIDPNTDGTHILKKAANNNVWVKGHRSGTRVSRVYSWLYNISEFVETFQTGDYNMTCQFLVQAAKQDEKEEHEHKTFNRYFKKITFHPNPQVMQLMGLMPGIGEVKCEALIAEFTTVWNVLNASPAELMRVHGIGTTLATTLLQRVGRVDV